MDAQQLFTAIQQGDVATFDRVFNAGKTSNEDMLERMTELNEHIRSFPGDTLTACWRVFSQWMEHYATSRQLVCLLSAYEHFNGIDEDEGYLAIDALGHTDNVEVLKKMNIEHLFWAMPQQSTGALCHLLAPLAWEDAHQCVGHLLAQPIFQQALGDKLNNGKPQPLSVDAAMVFLSDVSGRGDNASCAMIFDAVLDNISAVMATAMLDNHIYQCVSDPRFVAWEKKINFVRSYMLSPHSFVFDTHEAMYVERFPYALPSILGNRLAFELVSVYPERTEQEQQELVENMLVDHPTHALEIARCALCKLCGGEGQMSPPVFPNAQVEMVLNALSDEQVKHWMEKGWEHDETVSVRHYPKFVRLALQEHVSSEQGMARKIRM